MTYASSDLTNNLPTMYSTSKFKGVLYKCLSQERRKLNCHVRLAESSSRFRIGARALSSVPQDVRGATATTISRNQKLSSSALNAVCSFGSIKVGQSGDGSVLTNAEIRTSSTDKRLGRDLLGRRVQPGKAERTSEQMGMCTRVQECTPSDIAEEFSNTASLWRNGYENFSRILRRSLRSTGRNIFGLNWLSTTRILSVPTTGSRTYSY